MDLLSESMLIIFDLDGTLFQAKPVILLAVRRLLNELCVPVPEELLIMQNAPKGALPMLEALIGEDAGSSLSRYEQIMHDVILETGELFPSIPGVLERLARDGHELAVCSNSPEAYISLVLEHTGIAKWVTGYYSSETYPTKAALIGALIGETHAKNTPAVVVGDTHGDIEAAHENGLPAIAAMYGYGNADMLSSADGFAYSPGEIVTALYSSGIIGNRQFSLDLAGHRWSSLFKGPFTVMAILGFDHDGEDEHGPYYNYVTMYPSSGDCDRWVDLLLDKWQAYLRSRHREVDP